MPHCPRYSSPLITIPAPMPVPTAMRMTFSCPRAAPSMVSAQTAAFASFSTTTGRPTRSSTCGSAAARRARPGCGANSTLDRTASTNPAAPMPTASAWWRSSSSSDGFRDHPRGLRRAGGRRVPLELLDDAPVLVDDTRGDLGASDVNPDRQAHVPAPGGGVPGRREPVGREPVGRELVRREAVRFLGAGRATGRRQRPTSPPGRPRPPCRPPRPAGRPGPGRSP